MSSLLKSSVSRHRKDVQLYWYNVLNVPLLFRTFEQSIVKLLINELTPHKEEEFINAYSTHYKGNMIKLKYKWELQLQMPQASIRII
jgi:hypothetical protein